MTEEVPNRGAGEQGWRGWLIRSFDYPALSLIRDFLRVIHG